MYIRGTFHYYLACIFISRQFFKLILRYQKLNHSGACSPCITSDQMHSPVPSPGNKYVLSLSFDHNLDIFWPPKQPSQTTDIQTPYHCAIKKVDSKARPVILFGFCLLKRLQRLRTSIDPDYSEWHLNRQPRPWQDQRIVFLDSQPWLEKFLNTGRFLSSTHCE